MDVPPCGQDKVAPEQETAHSVATAVAEASHVKVDVEQAGSTSEKQAMRPTSPTEMGPPMRTDEAAARKEATRKAALLLKLGYEPMQKYHVTWWNGVQAVLMSPRASKVSESVVEPPSRPPSSTTSNTEHADSQVSMNTEAMAPAPCNPTRKKRKTKQDAEALEVNAAAKARAFQLQPGAAPHENVRPFFSQVTTATACHHPSSRVVSVLCSRSLNLLQSAAQSMLLLFVLGALAFCGLLLACRYTSALGRNPCRSQSSIG